MIHTFNAFVGNAAMERLTLLLNHVLRSEPVATERLRPHAGRSVQLELAAWPALLPLPPHVAFRVTPAGMLEWCGSGGVESPALRVQIDASNPAQALVQALTGARPKIEVSGDAALAGDLQWLVEHVRWDIQDDLARVLGAAPARELARLASGLAGGVREAVRRFGARAASGGGAPPPGPDAQ